MYIGTYIQHVATLQLYEQLQFLFFFSWNVVSKNEDINLGTNNASECIERETDSETSETEIKMDDSNGIVIHFY